MEGESVASLENIYGIAGGVFHAAVKNKAAEAADMQPRGRRVGVDNCIYERRRRVLEVKQQKHGLDSCCRI